MPESELLRRTIRPDRPNRAHRPHPDLRRATPADRPRSVQRPLQPKAAASSAEPPPATPRSCCARPCTPANQTSTDPGRADQRVRTRSLTAGQRPRPSFGTRQVRWHAHLVARRWTYPPTTTRPPADLAAAPRLGGADGRRKPHLGPPAHPRRAGWPRPSDRWLHGVEHLTGGRLSRPLRSRPTWRQLRTAQAHAILAILAVDVAHVDTVLLLHVA
jgi:hypothetical protein